MKEWGSQPKSVYGGIFHLMSCKAEEKGLLPGKQPHCMIYLEIEYRRKFEVE
jgi:hypothetical protein